MRKWISAAALLLSFTVGAQGDQPVDKSVEKSVDKSVDVSAQKYVKLVLALGQHDSGYVDAYYGPKQWQKDIEALGLSKKQIINKAQHLRMQLPDIKTVKDEMDRLRVHYLKKQLGSLIAHSKALAGIEKLDFDQQSRALYDTQAPHHKLEEFDAALADMAKMLPGEGPLYQRVDKFNRQFEIPKDKLPAIFARAIKECRDRTKVFVKLLENENFDLEYVKDKPWGGYNWYKGNAHSLIQVNTDFPIALSRAVALGCHEGYPGHHAYNALLEDNLVKKRGWVEYSVYPLYSPQSLIAEGSANYGIDMAFPGNEKAEFEKNVLFPMAGIDPALSATYQKYAKLAAKLGYASNEIARSYINGEINKEQAIVLTQKYRMSTRAKAEKSISFVDAYGAYVINYNWGRDMVKAYVEKATSNEERWKRFSRLLSSPRIPSSLNW
ncbi:MAG: hypothetical protein HRT35_02345 [Algicola sp.]|nr:hypothetical protein [Algicola sp.]